MQNLVSEYNLVTVFTPTFSVGVKILRLSFVFSFLFVFIAEKVGQFIEKLLSEIEKVQAGWTASLVVSDGSNQFGLLLGESDVMYNYRLTHRKVTTNFRSNNETSVKVVRNFVLFRYRTSLKNAPPDRERSGGTPLLHYHTIIMLLLFRGSFITKESGERSERGE